MRLFPILLAALFLTGCSAFRSRTQVVRFQGAPPGSTVTINDNGPQHPMPADVECIRNELVNWRVDAPGQEPMHGSIAHHLNFTGFLDAVGTVFLFYPVAGLFAPGSKSLDAYEVNVPAMAPASPAVAK